MTVVHEELGRIEAAIFSLRSESGIQEIRKWLYARRDKISDSWMEKEGDELLQLQGEARGIKKLIRMIDVGPTIKGVA